MKLIFVILLFGIFVNAQSQDSIVVKVPVGATSGLATAVSAGGATFSSLSGQITDNPTLSTALNNKLATNGSAANLTNIPVNQATGILPFANGGHSGSAATSATTGTMTVNMTTSIITVTPTGACTFNASGGAIGQIATFIITTSGVSSFTLTWGTNYRKTGTLATGTTSARFFAVTFVCIDGTIWQEIARTAAQT